MAKSTSKNIKRQKRLKSEARQRQAQMERINGQIRKAEWKDLFYSFIFFAFSAFLLGALAYAAIKSLIKFFS